MDDAGGAGGVAGYDGVLGVIATRVLTEAVIQELRHNVANVEVENYPDNPRNYQLRHPRGALLVRYGGAVPYGRDGSSARSSQRRVRIVVAVVARGLMGHGGAMDLLDELRNLLPGFAPDERLLQELRFEGEDYVNDEDGVWYFDQSWLAHDAVVTE